MRQSILFFDIDGTLLSDKTGKIPDSALEALAEAKKNGHLLFINTGRTVCALPKELYQFELNQIAARWPAKAVAQFPFSKKAVTRMSQDSIV